MRLRTFNNLLSLVVAGLGLYIALSPFLPQIAYMLRDKSLEASIPYSGELARSTGVEVAQAPPKENRIVVPSIQLDEPIIEANSIAAIKDGGTWRRPASSDPTQGSNTVIVGHRFYGSNTSTFYHLDKVLSGQKLAVYWDGVEYVYEVVETKVVEADSIEIEAPTADERLTLYTCTPIWTAKQRLVVIAKPVGDNW
jgi:sortase A